MRFDPMTTSLIMWIFGFGCGALCVWIRHQRAIAVLDSFVKPAEESRPDWQEDYPNPNEDVDVTQFNYLPNPNAGKTDKELQDTIFRIRHEMERR